MKMTEVVKAQPEVDKATVAVEQPKKKRLEYEIQNVTPDNIMQLKQINIATLPVRYSDAFYRGLNKKYSQDYLKLVFWGGFAVAACCAREELQENGDTKLYVMTINVLPMYRKRGIAGELLNYIMETAAKNKAIKEVYLHVQVNNLQAKDFYMHKGFEEVCVVENYYKDIEPTAGFMLRKAIVAV